MIECLSNQQNLTKRLRQSLVLFALVFMPIGAWAENYNIWIGDWTGYFDQQQNYHNQFVGVQVTSNNAADVLGDGTVSYADGILTLNGTTINGCIYSLGDLTIQLVGDNFISAVDSCAINCMNVTSAGILTLQGTGSLTMEGGTCISNFTTTLNNGLQYLFGSQNWFFTVIGTQLFSGGSGASDDDPYIITSAGELILLSKCINRGELTTKHFKIANDIDCTGVNNFEPIGSGAYPFDGFFDGNMKIISHLTCTTNANQPYTGFFGKIAGERVDNKKGIIKYIYLEKCTFEGGEHTGAIAGYLQKGEIWNCNIIDCTIKSGNYQNVSVGGIVGTHENGYVGNSRIIGREETEAANNGTVIYAVTSATGSSGSAKAGGLVGNIIIVDDEYAINGCSTEGNVDIKGSHAGTDCVVAAGGLFGGITPGNTDLKPRVDWNNVGTSKTISSEGDGNKIYAGAIAGQTRDAIELIGNFYYYDTKTLTKNNAATVEKSGYTQRGLGDGADDIVNNGAALKTQKLTLPASDADATYAPVAGTYYRVDGNDVYVSQHQDTKVMITPQKSDYVPTEVKVTYTDIYNNNKVETIIPAREKGKDDSYTYIFMMPDCDAVFNADIVYNKTYNLWINNTQVCEGNRNDILCDMIQWGTASFIYNPQNNNLIVTGYNYDKIESQIDEGLTIYLAPRRDCWLSSIAYTGKGNAPLTITTDGNYPGKLHLSNSDTPLPVISGFSRLTLEQNLIIISPEGIAYDGSNQKLATDNATIGVPLTPITRGKTIVPDGNRLKPESGSDDINKVVDDILYTLGNANNDTGDGYDDGGFIVINSVTTDQQAKTAAQDYAPGTDEYLDRFKGLTFMVPAGSGDIEFDMQTLEGYAMKVMVGDAMPVILEQAEKGKAKIKYNVSEPTYVYAYNAGKIGESNGARGVQKGKKTTVYIKIYTVGVNPKKVKSANPAGEASGGEYLGDTKWLEGQEIETDEEIEASKGDVNGDETANVADIIGIVNAIMGSHSPMFDKRAADVNSDGVINGDDIVNIVKKILK